MKKTDTQRENMLNYVELPEILCCSSVLFSSKLLFLSRAMGLFDAHECTGLVFMSGLKEDTAMSAEDMLLLLTCG